MVYLIGTNHELQHDAVAKRAPPEVVDAARDSFTNYLIEMAVRVGAVAIGEEFAEEVLSALRGNSLCKTVAAELNIKHLFCEPDSSTRLKLGVPACGTEHLPPHEQQRTDEIRENYWLGQLKSLCQEPVLFVCGSKHVKGFAGRLEAEKIPVSIESEYWGKEIYAA